MSDDNSTPPPVPVKKGRKSPFRRLSVVWIVPAIALLAVLAVAIKSYADRGPLIEITFDNASGIVAAQTELKYRDVVVGMVEDVGFTGGLKEVVVSVRLHKDVAEYVDSSARFWVVRPQVTAQGVSGLDTVLSGVYIEGIWDDTPGGLQTHFKGLADAPLERLGQKGLLLTLRASGDATLTEGAPILFQGITVGKIGKTAVSPDGSTAEAQAIIFAPHDKLVNSATRFWDTSGFSFTLGPGGAALDFSSLASLISGGVTFGTMVSGGVPLKPGTTMSVFADESSARAAVFSDDEGKPLNLSAVFEDNIAGLTVGAPVEMSGLNIGKVSALNGLVDSKRFGDDRVRLVATLAIQPGKLGLKGDQTDETALDFLKQRVADGLRARLATASILTGGLKVELTVVKDAPPAEIEQMGNAGPRIPTTKSDIADVSATAEGVFKRINDLPIEEVMNQAITLLGNANALVTSEGVREAPNNLNGLLTDARDVITSDDVKALPGQLRGVVDQLSTLIAQINKQDLTARLGKALDDAADAAKGVNTAIAGVPDLVKRIDAVAAKAQSVPIDDMANQLNQLLASADAILDQQSTRALPAKLNSALSDLSAILTQLREGGIVETAKNTLDSASNAANTVADTSRDLPKLIEQARQVLAEASTTIEGYHANNGLGRDARDALREVQRAAQAVTSLAKAIERNPNSLITGR